jgi:hypothetical protein
MKTLIGPFLHVTSNMTSNVSSKAPKKTTPKTSNETQNKLEITLKKYPSFSRIILTEIQTEFLTENKLAEFLTSKQISFNKCSEIKKLDAASDYLVDLPNYAQINKLLKAAKDLFVVEITGKTSASHQKELANKTLFIGNITGKHTTSNIRTAAKKIWNYSSIKVFKSEKQINVHFCFITFNSEEELKNAFFVSFKNFLFENTKVAAVKDSRLKSL